MASVVVQIMRTLVGVRPFYGLVNFWNIVLCALGTYVILDICEMFMMISSDYGPCDNVVTMWPCDLSYDSCRLCLVI